MLLYINHLVSDQARRLVRDLQQSGIAITQRADAARDLNLILLEPQTAASSFWEHLLQPEIINVPVILQPCPIPDPLTNEAIDLATNYDQGYAALLERLQTLARERQMNPYKGLAPYSPADAPYFFGRQGFVERLHQHIADGGQVIALVGPGGSGKTSLIQAGLIPSLQNRDQQWLPIYIKLENNPIQELAAHLQPFFDPSDSVSRRLATSAGGLDEVLREIGTMQRRVMLILDTFENVFTRFSLADRIYFLEALNIAITSNENGSVVVVALRADFERRLQEYPKWASLLQKNLFAVQPLHDRDLAEAIARPAFAVGAHFERSLIERITQDVAQGSEVGVMPRLSFTLRKLYDNQPLDLAQYDALGGVREGLERHLESVYSSLTAIQQLIARRILTWLVEVVDDGNPIARALPRSRFVFTWAQPDEVAEVINRLIDAQIVFERLDPESGDLSIAPSHETLPLEWKRLAAWLEDDAANLRYANALERKAEDWIARGYTDEALLRGTQLDEARSWVRDPDHLPSPLLLDYVELSNQLRESIEVKQVRQSSVRRRTLALLAALLALFGIIIALGAMFSLRTIQERDSFSTLQADTTSEYATAVAINDQLAQERDAIATGQAQARDDAATAQAQAEAAASAQAAAETAAANAAATAQALQDSQDANATAIAAASVLQNTAQAALNQAATAQVLAQSTAVQAEQQLRRYLASNLLRDVNALLGSDSELALRLAAEAATIALSEETDSTNGRAGEAMRAALQANATYSFSLGIVQSWFLGANFVVLDYAEAPDEFWQLSPPTLVTQLNGPVEQVIGIAGGRAFVVDYADDTPDEIWSTDSLTAGAQLTKEVAPPANAAEEIEIPNFIPLEDGNYFILRYEDEAPSDVWETATLKLVAELTGDVDQTTPLANGYFFVSYSDNTLQGGIWNTLTGQLEQRADDVIAVFYDNDIFALRMNGELDEVWRTEPFERLTQVVGRITTVTTIQENPYFITQYAGGQPAQIWNLEPPIEVVYTFRGDIDVSHTVLDRQYFFVRYADGSASELWKTDPLGPVATLNGNLANIDLDELAADQQVLVVDYTDNTVSEVWSLPEGRRTAQLNGNMEASLSILGDVYFVVRYEGNQPAEVWSAIDSTIISTLGAKESRATNVIPLKGGTFLVVMYETEPAEIWQVDVDKVELLVTLPEVATRTFAFADGDYLLFDFLNGPAQIWQTTPSRLYASLTEDVLAYNYNTDSRRLNFVDGSNRVFSMDFQVILDLNNAQPPLTDADLLRLTCDKLTEASPIADETLTPFLAGLPPAACQDTALQ